MAEDVRTRVLLVDDDRLDREIIRGELVGLDMLVEVADSMEAGLRAADAFQPEVAVLDVALPLRLPGPAARIEDALGLELAKALRERYKQLGIVFLTRWLEPDQEIRQQSVDLGDQASYLTKPCTRDELEREINRVKAPSSGVYLAPRPQAQPPTAVEAFLKTLDRLEREAVTTAAALVPGLSERQLEVFKIVGACRSNAAAEQELGDASTEAVPEGSDLVRYHLENIYKTLQLTKANPRLNHRMLLAKVHVLYCLQQDAANQRDWLRSANGAHLFRPR